MALKNGLINKFNNNMEEIKMLTLEQQTMVEENMALAVYTTNKWHRMLQGKLPYDEIRSSCFLGLTKACKHFKVDKNIKLATYAVRVMENEIFMTLRKYKNKQSKDVVFSSLVGRYHSDNEEFDGSEFLKDMAENNIDEHIEKEELKYLLSKLKPFHREMVVGMYLKNKTQQELAKEYGKSQSYISRVITRALIQMKKNAC
jgi:RNA polymerase sporulation-specific sigma factor